MPEEDNHSSSPEPEAEPRRKILKSKTQRNRNDIFKILLDLPELGNSEKQLLQSFIGCSKDVNEETLLLSMAPAVDQLLYQCTDEATWTANYPALHALATLVKSVLSRRSDIVEVARVVDIVKRLVDTLSWSFVKPPSFKSLVSTGAVKLIEKTTISAYLPVAMPLLNYLLDVTLKGPTTLASETSKFKCLKSFVLSLNFDNAALEPLKKRFLEAMGCPKMLKPQSGATVLAAFLSRNENCIEEAQEKIKKSLALITKMQAQVYGHVYFYAWSWAEKHAIQKAIEIKCIQDLIGKVFQLKRGASPLAMGNMGEKVLAVLHQLHEFRRHRKFSLVITELYTPFIFRNLKNYNDAIRCNAAQVLFDVFPLEVPGKGAFANTQLYNSQIKEIKDLLLDDCHYVRILALRGISNILPEKTEVFQKQDIQDILNIVCDKLAFDASSPQVRAAVFDGFAVMVTYEEMRKIILPILSKMRNHLHDDCEAVRVSFLRLLLRIKSLDVDVWSVVDLSHVIYRLKGEKEVVCSLIAKLLMPGIFVKGQALFRTFSKIVRLISFSAEAAIQLFQYSSPALDSDGAFEVVLAILGMLCSKVIELENKANRNDGSTENEGNECESRSPAAKKNRRSPLRDIANETEENSDLDNSSTTNSSCSSSGTPPETTEGDDFMSDHNTIDALFQIAAILWYNHLEKFIAKGDLLDRLYTLCCTLIPFCQRLYSGKKVYYTVISFSSLIPVNKLHQVSTTGSLCISHLKKINVDQTYELKCLVTALSSWNRGTDVLELITESLNEVFRHVNLNSSVFNKKSSGRVRFAPVVTCQPSVAIKLFELLLGNRALQAKELERNYSAVYDTHQYLARVKTVIESRLSRGEPFEHPSLDDEFLLRCFQIYLESIIILHRPDGVPSIDGDSSQLSSRFINAGNAFRDVIAWAKEAVIPCLPAESSPPEAPSIAVHLVKILLTWLNTSIRTGCSNTTHCVDISEFGLSLLTTGCPLFWIDVMYNLIAQLSSFANVYDVDDSAGLFSLHISRLIQISLELLTASGINSKNLCNFIKNPNRFKNDFFAGLLIISKRFGSSSDIFKKNFQSYMVACVLISAREMAGEVDEELAADIRQQPHLVDFILKFFLSKPTLAVNVLPTLDNLLELFKEEPLNLVSCLKLVVVVIFSGRVNDVDDEFLKCYQHAESLVNDHKSRRSETSSLGNNSRLNDTSFSGCSLNILAVADKILTDVKDFLMVAR